MQIDITKIGYRWVGQYSSTATYKENDVVFKDSGTYRVDASGNLIEFALGQSDVTTKGHLLTGGTSVGGVNSQILHSKLNSGIEFRHTDERNGTYVKRLMNDGKNGTHRGGYHGSAYDTPMVVMSDGTVRVWGRKYSDGRAGTGVSGDNLKIYRPQQIAFPKGVVIENVYGSVNSKVAVDSTGQSWGWGKYDGHGTSAVSNNPIPKKHSDTLPELANEKIVDVSCSYAQYGDGHVLLLTESGKVYGYGENGYSQLGDGTTTDVYSIKRIGAELDSIGKVKRMFNMGSTYGFTILQLENNDIYKTGTNGNRSVDPSGSVFQKVTKFNGVGSPIKDITSHVHDLHATAGSQYYGNFITIHENGNAYYMSSGFYSSNTVGTQGFYNNNIVVSDPFDTNVKQMIGMNGGYPKVLSLRNDGTIWHRGINHGTSPTGASTTAWNQYTDYNGNAITNVNKIFAIGGHYVAHFSALTSDGLLYCWGLTQKGSDGVGIANTNDPSTGLRPVKIPEKIIDYAVYGYGSSGTGNFLALALTESNTCYTFGWNSSYYSANDFNGNRPTPKIVVF